MKALKELTIKSQFIDLRCLNGLTTSLKKLSLSAAIGDRSTMKGMHHRTLIYVRSYCSNGHPLESSSALITILRSLGELDELVLAVSELDGDHLFSLAACKQLSYLEFKDMKLVFSNANRLGFSFLSSLDRLHTLKIDRECILVGAKSLLRLPLEALAPSLRILSLPNASFSDELLDGIEHLQDLRKLKLSSTAITDAILTAVARSLPRLEFLDVAGCKSLTAAAIATTLKMLPYLRVVNVSSTKADDNCLRVLEGSVELQELAFTNSFVTIEGLQEFAPVQKTVILFYNVHRMKSREELDSGGQDHSEPRRMQPRRRDFELDRFDLTAQSADSAASCTIQ